MQLNTSGIAAYLDEEDSGDITSRFSRKSTFGGNLGGWVVAYFPEKNKQLTTSA
jgi:hypothetical protein